MGVILKALPISQGTPLNAQVGARAYKKDIDFSTGATQSFTLPITVSDSGLDTVQSLFIDNSNSPGQFVISIIGSGQKIVCPPYSQGFFPVIFTPGQNFQANLTNSGAVVSSITLLNVESDLNIWNVTTPTGQGTQTVQGTVTVAPSIGAYTDRSGAIAAGSTSQQLCAANGTRKRLFIKNPASVNGQIAAGNTLESLYINFTSAAGVDDGHSIELVPGESFDTGLGPCTSELVNVTAATAGHRFIAREM